MPVPHYSEEGEPAGRAHPMSNRSATQESRVGKDRGSLTTLLRDRAETAHPHATLDRLPGVAVEHDRAVPEVFCGALHIW